MGCEGHLRDLRNSQRGWTLFEAMMAGFLSLLLLGSGGILFRFQLAGYKDIQEQSRIQAGMKKALHAMTRIISTTGAGLDSPRNHFRPQADRLSLAYADIRGAHCDDGATLFTAFQVSRIQGGDALVQTLRCEGGGTRTRTLATAPPGRMDLEFLYFDRRGARTTNPAAVASVEVRIALLGKKIGNLPVKRREQAVRIRFANL